MLNIKQIQIMSIALLVVATAQGMQPHKVIGEIQIHRGNEVCFIGEKEYKAIQAMGIPQSSCGSSMPAIKVDCFTQQGGEEYNWTKGELKPAFPKRVPVSMLWGLEADSKISFETKINGQPTAIELYLRENFETDQSPAEQMKSALDSFVKNAHVKSAKNVHIKSNNSTLEEELIKKGLIRQVDEYAFNPILEKELIKKGLMRQDALGLKITQNIHNTGLGNQTIFEDILNRSSKNEVLQKKISQDFINDEERQEILSTALKPSSQTIVHLLRNREIGRK